MSNLEVPTIESSVRQVESPLAKQELPLIPIFRPFYDEAEVNAVAEVLKSGWIGLGPRTAEFEQRFAALYRGASCSGGEFGYGGPALGADGAQCGWRRGHYHIHDLCFVESRHSI